MQLETELNRIQDEDFRHFIKIVLEIAPTHFWTHPASSTGKYHSPDENLRGGLILHTSRVCSAAEILIESWKPPFSPDVIRGACILHDVCKYGMKPSPSQYTLRNHPELASELVDVIHRKKFACPEKYFGGLRNAIERHMGKWGRDIPQTSEDWIVHLSDVITTRIQEVIK